MEYDLQFVKDYHGFGEVIEAGTPAGSLTIPDGRIVPRNIMDGIRSGLILAKPVVSGDAAAAQVAEEAAGVGTSSAASGTDEAVAAEAADLLSGMDEES